MKKLSALALTLSLLIAGTATVHAGFTVQTTTPRVYQLDYEDNPGDTIKDEIVIKNTGDEPITLKLYAADGTLTRQGTFTVTGEKDTQRTIGLWTKMSQDTVTVDGKSEQKVSFTVTLPDKLTPGSYAGGIVASTLASETATPKATGVTVVTGSVLPLYITVPGAVVHKFDWQDLSHTVNALGNHSFHLKFKNTGNTVIIFQTSVEIYGKPDGIDPEEIARSQSQEQISGYTKEDQKRLNERILENTMTTNDISLFQDQEVEIPLTWGKQPFFGEYTAKATTTYWELNLTTGIKSNPKAVTKEITFSVTPWWLIELIAGLVVLIGALLLAKNFYQQNQKKHAEKYVVSEKETLTSIAEKKKVDWKKIIKMNKLHPPYELKKDQILLLPPVKKSHEK